ncbi:MAG: substrate-binding domain-containing protein [Planctomycetota bacterium]|jgi:phosphate transport system substrate-binding protein|nr:substrate-binding domain-containing protein [Planctomycetota bacterium]MDP6762815.1 substrate-binding domain-containing protein [Planctomycetota bacterium]MDP6990489.1 substrate-binding domain-containing protein [Planctomycetota bacterium]
MTNTPFPRPRPPRAVLAACALACAACHSAEPGGPPTAVSYVGSSTVAVFLRDAAEAYPAIDFTIDSAPESAGGELAMREGRARLAGVAAEPAPKTLAAGVRATLVGRDAIAVIVHADNPIDELSFDRLRAVFTGVATDWAELGGSPGAVRPFIVGPESATREVFRAALLGEGTYGPACREVRPDREIVAAVAADPGAIGHISFSFLGDAQGVRAIGVGGQVPEVTNFDYPISRPLYLLHRPGDRALDAFVGWALSDAGQRVVMRHFVGARVVGSVESPGEVTEHGWLIVDTRTFPVIDGGIYYYPHRPYAILSRHGEPLREVRNHSGHNDEKPTRVALAPGVYLIRAEAPDTGVVEFFVRIEAGKTAGVSVADVLGERR